MQEIDQLLDEKLVTLFQEGQHAVFAEIYRRYKGLLVFHVVKKLGNVEDAKEIVQELFTELWNNREKLPPINNLKAFLYVMARNRVLNHLQHLQVVAKYEQSFKQFSEQYVSSTDIILREKEMLKIIDREIEALPPKMKSVFLLSRKEHLTHKEIATALSISEFTVKNHIKAALKILRTRLDVVTFLVFLAQK